MYLGIRACAFPTQKFTTVIVTTSNKHQLINTSAAEQSCVAEALCSCFWVKQGLSLQLQSHSALLLPPFWPPPTMLCSVVLCVGSAVLHRYPQELWRRLLARIRCQKYFIALQIFLLPFLPILKSWHCLSSSTYLLLEPIPRTQML